MRKALVMFLIIGLLAFVVACSPDSSLNEELVNVTISSRDTRALEASTNFNINDVRTWKYTAKKADNGLKTGETTEQVELIDGKTQQLSQGSWNFELFGYNGEGKLICSGKTNNPTTITIEMHTITIQVGALTTAGGMGKIAIADDIKIVDKDGNSVADGSTEYKKTVIVRNSNGDEVTDLDEVPSGVYSVEVVYTGTAKDGTTYTAASEKKYFNVFDNLTTTVSGNIKELTQAGDAKPEERKVVASVDGQLYTSIADALKAATVDKPLILTSDATLEESIVLSNDADINLNGNILTFADEQNITIIGDNEAEAKVTIENGTIIGGKGCSTIKLDTHSNLILDSIKMTANTVELGKACGLIYLYQGANPASLTVKNSELIMDGAYCIATNAAKGPKTFVNIVIENSTVIAQNDYIYDNSSAGLCVNVPAIVTITGSTIKGEQVGVLFRGISDDASHIATVNDSIIECTNSTTNEYKDKDWETGLNVPSGALVVGNRNSTAYKNPTTVVLNNVELKSGNGVDIFAYQNNETEKVTITGTVKGEYSVNSKTNGAFVISDSTTKSIVISSVSSINELKDLDNKEIKVLLDEGTTDLTLDTGYFNEGALSKSITLVGKLDDYGNPCTTIDVVKNSQHITSEGEDLNYQKGSTFTFKNLVIESGEGNYNGIVCGKVTYENCVIKNSLTLYGEATFIDCTFENNMTDQYSIRTWGGTDVTFEGCTFNTNGKAILMFGEEKKTTLNVSNCIFNDREKGAAGKAAIEVGEANYGKHNTFTLNINDCEVNDFANGKNTDSKLWANKNSMDSAHLTVTIDGKKIQ